MVRREDAKKEVILVYSLVICLLWILIQFAKRGWQIHMKNEYFQNDVIDLRILDNIGSVCIYRFPISTADVRINLNSGRRRIIC